uniref:7-carboxy-7-deazaguanine synthase n=1 Tax=Candidatus Kentrum sp. FW TaxID=2126338 RepID=A0A450SFH3_9GAMM|nr:MAG: 7-carboxy-7-deazaguanine synthase [Candidatus Kentron sp. FW]VFJ71143.1 MAG: 7-carboxy-7-deazaguanine synthase [Candidatus Kentron sp. FW]
MPDSPQSSHHEQLRITEIFYSLQGETRTIGYPTVFIRLTGCPLRCVYCDTRYAFHGGQQMSPDRILAEVNAHQPHFVTVTGGEPLMQPACHRLITRLCDAGYQVSLETSGALDITAVDERVSIVMDLKTPGSGEVRKNRYRNLARLSTKDQVKFVVCDHHDYEWAKARLREFHIPQHSEVLFLPVHAPANTSPSAPETLTARTLADWILADRLPARMQIQLHKVLWGDVPGK